MISVREQLRRAVSTLGADARLDAEVLFAHALGRDRAWLVAHAEDKVDPATSERFSALLGRRAEGEPVAYLTGMREFWSLPLAVTSDVLIPRPETELLVELALQRIRPDRATRIVDLGTGSGAIALAIGKERPRAQIVATDSSDAALAVAAGNAHRLGIANIEFRLGAWLTPLAGESFDLIASNPPYIAFGDSHRGDGDLRFEPELALTSGSDGMDSIRIIVAGAAANLVAGGWLLFEHGFEQGDVARGLLEAAGFTDVFTHHDLEYRDRVSGGRRPPS